MKQKNPQFPAKSLYFKPGDLVVGIRNGLKDNYIVGYFVEHYYTLNKGFRNYASRIKRLRDNKIVSFQVIRGITPNQIDTYEELRAAYKEKLNQFLEIRRKGDGRTEERV